ncbi:MAG: DUF1295 domain-containing protein [Chloroflexi bacterium]|nr:MAG: DUF1295 domain-containing protein [Chloroflexota bacterium]
MSFLEVYLVTLGIILSFFTILWIISLVIKDASIVDIFWGSGFVVAALSYFALTEGFATRKILVLALVAIWGLRLTLHIGKRNIGKGEDFRYRKWREQFGKRWWWLSYIRVYLLQALILWVVSIPTLAAQYHQTPNYLTIFDVLGIVIWGIGFYFEAVGDWQLTRFKANPENKGKLLTTGLWAWTRHPNYFGDAAVWWGLYLFAVATPWGFLTFFGPLAMNFLLLRVSGVALLEKSLSKRKPGYEEYIENTPAFIPRPPKRKR